MKKNILFLVGYFLFLNLFSQTNAWIWQKGDLIGNSTGTMGTNGVFAPANIPPGLYGPAYWTGKDGYFYIYAGYNPDASTAGYKTNSLWKYDPRPGATFNQWTRMWQNTGAPAVPVGTFDAAYGPNVSGLCIPTWVDNNGYLWLLDDNGAIWKYDPYPGATFNQWAKMHAGAGGFSSVGVWGVKGIPSPGVYPNATGGSESIGAWTDSKNNLWFFSGHATSNVNTPNDAMWMFNTATNEWAWMAGTDNSNEPTVRGTQGVAAPANTPGARWVYLHWTDKKDNLWLLGSGTADLWKYDTGTNLWTWVGGTIVSVGWPGYFNNYVSNGLCNEDPANVPAEAEMGEARAQWTDSCGNFWFYGADEGRIWKYKIATGNWILVKNAPGSGGNNLPIRGVQGVANVANTPGGYDSGVPFQNNEGFWFWYGENTFTSNSRYNDMWEYIPDKPTASYTYLTSACGNGNVNFTSTSVPNCNEIKSYRWDFGDPGSGAANTSTIANPSHLYPSTGNYTVKLIVTNCTMSRDSSTQIIPVSVSTPWTLGSTSLQSDCNTSNGSATITISGGSPNYTYNWNTGASAATSAGSNTITALSTSSYTVTVSDAAGCSAISVINLSPRGAPVITSMPVTLNGLCAGSITGNVSATVAGAVPITYSWSTGGTTASVSNLAPGFYTVTVTDAHNCTSTSGVSISDAEPVLISIPFKQNSFGCQFPGGYLYATVSGGSGSYTYNWSNGYTGVYNAGLAGGVYTLTVTDVKGCSAIAKDSITSPVRVTTISTSAILCNSGSALVTASTSGGGFNYTYSWSSGTSSATTATTETESLTVGNYTVTVTDGLGCTSISPFSLTEPPGINVATSPIVAACGTSTGGATVTATGGSGTLTYSWSNGPTSQTISGVAAGTYTITVTDANNCSKTALAVVNNNPSPTINSLSKTDLLCNGNGTGSVVVSAGGGTGSLTYSWSNAASGATAITGLSAGTYIVSVTDASGCTAISTVSITEPLPLNANTIPVSTSCGVSNGSASVTATGGTGAYSYVWSNAATTQTAVGLSVGIFTVTVTDINSCTKTATASINNSSSPGITTSVSSAIQCNGGTGAASATTTGSTSPYTFSWSTGASAVTTNLTAQVNLIAGIYTVTIIDAQGCNSTSTFNLSEPAILSANTSPATTACGTSNGSATVTAAGGTGAFTYFWSTGGTSQTISGLAAGSYTVTVADANNCNTTAVAAIGNIPAPTINSATGTSLLCNGNNGGSALVDASGGTGALTYSWSNGTSGTTSIAGLSAGTYVVSVSDANGCTAVSTISITEPSPISTPAFTIVNSTCGVPNGNIIASASGGSGSLTFSWSNGVSGFTASGLLAGNYTLSVTDANSCTTTATAAIIGVGSPSVATAIQSSILCQGGIGSVNASVSGGSVPFTYSWSNGSSSATSASSDLQSVLASTYIVSVTDANGCTATNSIIITEPKGLSAPIFSTTDAACGQSNGSTILSVTGGTGALTYSWSNGTSGATNNNLSAGTYLVTITDANGCSKMASASVNNAGGPSVNSFTPLNELCNGANTGAATVVISGGASPFTYSWSSGTSSITNSTTQQISNLLSGIYSVTITDANNCKTISTTGITEPGAISTPTFINANATCANSNGSSLASVSGGSGSYTYSWSNGTSGATNANLSAGAYTVTIRDANGCSKTASSAISNAGGPSVNSFTPLNELCNGGNTGTATVVISGGASPYMYSWSSGTSSITNSTTQQINNLVSGSYAVTITDANNCKTISTTSITEPGAVTAPTFITANPTCTNSNGSAFASASGGSGSYTYNWSNSTSGATASGLSAASYTVTVTDANGCSNSASVIMSNSNGPSITLAVPSAIACNGGVGVISVSTTGGSAPYTYNWSNGTVATTTSLSVQLSNLSSAIYSITISDASGCSSSTSINLTQPPPISSPTFIATSAGCGLNNGAASVSSSGGTGTLTYNWSNSVTGTTATNLSAGTYTVVVKDANNCSISNSVLINNNPAPTISKITSVAILCKGNSTGTANVAASGTGALSYTWSAGAGNATTATGLSAGTYTVTVADGNGCKAITTIVVAEPSTSVIINSINAINSSCGKNNGTASVSAIGGTGSLSYNWSNSVSGATVSGLSAANYTVTVTDANSCTATSVATIGNTVGPNATVVVSATIPCNGGLGSVTASATGGSSPFTYSWSNGPSSVTNILTSQISSLTSATYNVTITDALGCSSTSTINLTQPILLSSVVSSQSSTCTKSNGSVKAVITGGTPVYIYSWSNGSSSATSSLNDSIVNLSGGVYTVTITDSKGCSSTASSTVTTLGTGAINIVPAQQTILEGTSVALNANGGVTYTWSPSDGLSCINCSNPTAQPTKTTTYTIIATDTSGCQITAMITIIVKPPCIGDESDIFIANVFSPNNDGKNDLLYIEGNGLANIYWAIYDRWGNLLFETYNQSTAWDGAKKGNPMESGTYVYYLKATCVKTNTEVKLKGNITIVK